jgi:hypothetical protein
MIFSKGETEKILEVEAMLEKAPCTLGETKLSMLSSVYEAVLPCCRSGS